MWETLKSIVFNATLTDWALLGGGLLALFYVCGTWTYDTFTRKGLASMRTKLPFVGNNRWDLMFGYESMTAGISEMYNSGKGHSVFGFFEFLKPIYMIRDADLVKAITVKEFDHFPNHRQTFNEKTDPVFGKTLFFSRDQRWRDMRATLSPAFTTSKIKNMFPLITLCGEQMAKHLREKHADNVKESGNEKYSVEMKNLFSRFANDVIATSAFGLECDSLKQPDNEFFRMGKLITHFAVSRLLIFATILLFPFLKEVIKISALNPKAVKFFEKLIHEAIAERDKKNIFRPDILQLLMQARQDELKTESSDAHEVEKIKANKMKLDNEDILAQAVIFFFAGFETVSTAMTFTTFALSTHPDVQKRLHEEIDAVMKQTNGKLTYEAVQSMKYLDMVVNETLRLYPPFVAVDRECRENATLPATDNSPAFTMKVGDVAFIPIVGIHHDPKYWPEPMKFDPERFSDENKHNIKPFSYLPFGLGPRICVGQRFALLEVKIAIIQLVANFEIYRSPKLKMPIEFEPGFNTMIKGGAWCDLVPRDVNYNEDL